MSECCFETITCPKCNAKGKFRFWSSINVDLDPEMKEKIFNEEIFMWTCPECGANVYVPFGTLYHDMKNNFMIFFAHEALGQKKETSIEMPNLPRLNDTYTFRSVYGIMNLKEKILILENGLNDIAVEKFKYLITHHMIKDMSERDTKLFFQGVTDPDKENEYGRMVFYCQEEDEENSDHIALPMQHYYQQCLSLEIDNRFSVKGCVCVDQEWISNKMKGVE